MLFTEGSLMAGDWVKLHRKMLTHEVMRKDWPCRIWTWCLLKANYSERRVFGIDLKPGQFVTGRFSGAAELRVTPSKFWRGLQLLRKWNQIELKSDNSKTIVTICNWQTYQDNENEIEHLIGQQSDSNRTAIGQQSDTDKELKNIRNKENTPPQAKEPTDLLQKWYFFNPSGPHAIASEIVAMFDELRRHGVTDAEIEAEIVSPTRVRGEWPSKFRDRILKTKNGKPNKKSFEDHLADALSSEQFK